MMKDEVSALLDGELEQVAAERQIDRLKADSELRQTWDMYHLIGDALRGHVTPELCSRVTQRLAEEPTVLAPKPQVLELKRLGRWALSAAAGGAAVALVLWMAVPIWNAPEPQLVRAPAGPATLASSPESAASAAIAPAGSVVNDYLLAHQHFSVTSALQGVAPYVRTVSGAEESRR
jgi:sigma-E factor negative regulatory protein RseA